MTEPTSTTTGAVGLTAVLILLLGPKLGPVLAPIGHKLWPDTWPRYTIQWPMLALMASAAPLIPAQ
jgi:hypothetical protein